MASPDGKGGSVHGQMLPKRIPAWQPGQEDTAFRWVSQSCEFS